MKISVKKKDWIINEDAFGKLLGIFDPNVEKAGVIYEKLRSKLITKFRFRGSFVPEDHADVTFNIVARRVADDGVVLDENYEFYFFRVAQNVIKEYIKSNNRSSVSIEDLPYGSEPSENPLDTLAKLEDRIEQELGFEAIAECRDGLTSEEREIFDIYFGGAENELKQKERRRAFGEKLGITLNNLGTKASRIKRKLSECLRKKFSKLQRK